MSSQPTCGNCRHWDAGLCCRFPPAVVPPAPSSPGDTHLSSLAFVFPETTEGMTCGEWSSKMPAPVVTYTVATDELIERRAE
jgi:hypothetical protein